VKWVLRTAVLVTAIATTTGVWGDEQTAFATESARGRGDPWLPFCY
jgi:hypothetical protein